jgi:hypothetical protein
MIDTAARVANHNETNMQPPLAMAAASRRRDEIPIDENGQPSFELIVAG